MRSVDLAILNFNGRKHLEFLLPTALAEAGRYLGSCRVVVVDNHSEQAELDWIGSQFPEVVVWRAPRNDFLFSYNEFAKASKADVLLLLNNDLKLCPDFIAPLLRYFAEPDVFAVGATSRDWDDREFTCGPSKLKYSRGFYDWRFDAASQKRQHTFFASGGFMAVDRAKFLELGGFDRLFHPAYCEDVDLCLRAWRRGWPCIFEPQSIVLHRETGSWTGAGKRRVDRMQLRNALLLQWTSLPMDKQRLQRWTQVLKLMCGTLLSGSGDWTLTYLRALRCWLSARSSLQAEPLDQAELRQIMERIESPVS
jgi:GT2 family glycosyltransferase